MLLLYAIRKGGLQGGRLSQDQGLLTDLRQGAWQATAGPVNCLHSGGAREGGSEQVSQAKAVSQGQGMSPEGGQLAQGVP